MTGSIIDGLKLKQKVWPNLFSWTKTRFEMFNPLKAIDSQGLVFLIFRVIFDFSKSRILKSLGARQAVTES